MHQYGKSNSKRRLEGKDKEERNQPHKGIQII
jgi:hypothetical protein